MTDIQTAKANLAGHTVCLVKGESIFKSTKRGVAPLLEFIDGGRDFSGFSAADKIVGKAAALLYAHMGVKEVYAEVMSKSAEQVLKAQNIMYSYGIIAEKIINRKGDGVCPMEDAVENISSPHEAVTAIKNKLKLISSGNF